MAAAPQPHSPNPPIGGNRGEITGDKLAELNDGPVLTAALAYAELGWPVLPVAGLVSGRCGCRARDRCRHPAKHPLIKNGTRAASLEPAQLREWWTHWPWAGVGLLTGRRSGLVVVDVDPGHGGDVTLAGLLDRRVLPATVTQRSGSGGRHLLYQLGHDSRAGNTSGRLATGEDTPGVDLRGEGGYIVAAPSRHISGGRYRWQPGSDPLATAPTVALRRARPTSATASLRSQGGGYAHRALAGEVTRVTEAAEGIRNDTLNRAAFSLGTLVGAGGLDRAEVEHALADAAASVDLPDREAERTIRSGLDAGERRPRTTGDIPPGRDRDGC